MLISEGGFGPDVVTLRQGKDTVREVHASQGVLDFFRLEDDAVPFHYLLTKTKTKRVIFASKLRRKKKEKKWILT